MRQPRRRRGFEQAGAVPAAQLGFPSRRARELTLVQGWERVAGKTLSRHARALAVVRGVLQVEAEDRAWYDAVEPLLPQLAARIAVEHPRLGIKKFVLRHTGGGGETPQPVVVPEYVEQEPGNADADVIRRRSAVRERSPGAAPLPQAPQAPQAPTTDDLQRRLERAAHRYAERKVSQNE